MLPVSEFDKFADEYLASHAKNLRISGEDPEYFARYKIDELHRVWTRRAYPDPKAILDFGSGIGAALPHLASRFPAAALTAFDVSARSLALAEYRFPGLATFIQGADLSVMTERFDLIFTSCVFHHVDADLHVAILAQLRDLLNPGGRLVIFEHNPINPVTRYIVATCPFDENAILIQSTALTRRQRAAGFARVETRYTGFFPRALAWLRWLEPHLGKVPIGAQYYTLASHEGRSHTTLI